MRSESCAFIWQPKVVTEYVRTRTGYRGEPLEGLDRHLVELDRGADCRSRRGLCSSARRPCEAPLLSGTGSVRSSSPAPPSTSINIFTSSPSSNGGSPESRTARSLSIRSSISAGSPSNLAKRAHIVISFFGFSTRSGPERRAYDVLDWDEMGPYYGDHVVTLVLFLVTVATWLGLELRQSVKRRSDRRSRPTVAVTSSRGRASEQAGSSLRCRSRMWLVRRSAQSRSCSSSAWPSPGLGSGILLVGVPHAGPVLHVQGPDERRSTGDQQRSLPFPASSGVHRSGARAHRNGVPLLRQLEVGRCRRDGDPADARPGQSHPDRGSARSMPRLVSRTDRSPPAGSA